MRLRMQGNYAKAIPIAQDLVALREKTLGPDHPQLAPLLNNLAELYRNHGRYADAAPHFKRSLAIAEKALGPNHPDVAAILNNLAALRVDEGRLTEAEPLYRRSLSIREKALGPQHLHVAITLNNLASLYLAAGRYAEAEPLFKRSQDIREKALGATHPDVATVLSNLAELYRVQGRYTEAEPHLQRSIAIREKSQGPEHPDTANLLNNLAALHMELGRYAEAERIYKRSLSAWEKALGLEHPNIANALTNLANLYVAQGRYAEAEPLLKRSVALLEKALGPEHPKFATLLNNLGALYKTQGRYAEAIPHFERSLSIREKRLGPMHPDVAASLNNLAAVYREQGIGQAEPLYKRSLAIVEKSVGEGHPHVATALHNLAGIYVEQGRSAEAEALYVRSIRIVEKGWGADHPQVAATLSNLAQLAVAQGKWEQAAGHWRRATGIVRSRMERGHSSMDEEKGRLRQTSRYFAGLLKATYRLAARDRTSRAAEMFEVAQWAQGSEAADAIAQMAIRSAKGSANLATLVRERQDLLAEWRSKDKELVGARSAPPASRSQAREEALANRLAAIDARVAGIDARFARDFPDYAALSSLKAVSVTHIQAQLDADEALVLTLNTDASFEPVPEETFVWIVTKTDLRWTRSDLGTAALEREVVALRCGLDIAAWHDDGATRCAGLVGKPGAKPPQPGEPLPFDAGRAHALYKGIFGEAADTINGKKLIIVPSGALTTLPFQVLVTKPPASLDLRSAAWLIRDHATTVLPSVASLTALRRTARVSVASKRMIGFANPLLNGNQGDPVHGAWFKKQAEKARMQAGCATTSSQRAGSVRGLSRAPAIMPRVAGLADIALIHSQSPLPETAEEVCEVARGLGADVADMRIGKNATESEVKRLSAAGDLARFRMVHFATHGLLAGQLSSTNEPGLILTPPAQASQDDDGFLSASEIAGLRLNADFVILSACNTAGGNRIGEGAEALSGLARAFFYAQARALFVSHWEVDSKATVGLVTTMASALQQTDGVGRAEALRRAMLTVMADSSRPVGWVQGWHPSIWAPFIIVGEGGARR